MAHVDLFITNAYSFKWFFFFMGPVNLSVHHLLAVISDKQIQPVPYML